MSHYRHEESQTCGSHDNSHLSEISVCAIFNRQLWKGYIAWLIYVYIEHHPFYRPTFEHQVLANGHPVLKHSS